MEPLLLHYSRGKLIRLSLLSLVMMALGLWMALGGIAPGEELHGRGAWLGELLGPQGLQVLGWAMFFVVGLLAILTLRRAFGDLVAARADGTAVTIHTIFGSHQYRAEDLAGIEIRRPAGQGILQFVPVRGQGKQRGLTLNSLAEDEDEIAAWIEAVWARLRSGTA
ncbi:MAG TPA: hypothetical protein VGC35_10995 [Allosphingosinicella sp.]|jgi:hypothetical protein